MAERRRTLRNDPQIRRFLIDNARVTGKKLGVGSYGSVQEVEANGVVCAGKTIHPVLVEGYEGLDTNTIVTKFVAECELMSDLRHPHIVQFLGLCFLEESHLPVLVMERMATSLDSVLESKPNIPLGIKLSMLSDMVKALCYLHSHKPSPIIHRDLSSRNVLLTTAMVAKVSDLGNSRIVDLYPGEVARTLSRAPGTQVYMPPEALEQKARYGTSLDIFSFGQLALFTLTQVFPGDLRSHTYRDPHNQRRLIGRSEVERREDYFVLLQTQLGGNHLLMELIERCLDNEPEYRPSAEEVLQQLMEVEVDDPYRDLTKLDMIELIQQQRERDPQNEGRFRLQLQQMQLIVSEKELTPEENDLVIKQKDREIQQLQMELKRSLRDKDEVIQKKEKELKSLQFEMERAQKGKDGLQRKERKSNPEHISRNPFPLDFHLKTSQVVTGLNLEDNSFQIGVPYRFVLHCEGVGDGSLEFKSKPASAATVHLVPIKGKNSYSCEILPIEAGTHEIIVQYGGKHILGSPFNVHFKLRGDASKVKMVECHTVSGDIVNVCISTEGAGKGSLTASVLNTVTKEPKEVSMSQIAEDRYIVEFSPGNSTEYLLSVQYDNQHILGSPFKLVVVPPAPGTSQCTAEGEGLISAQVEKWSKFTVNTEGAAAVELKVTIEMQGESVEPIISTVREGVYEVTYLPVKPGWLSIAVLFANDHIPGSPFKVRCYHPANPSLLSILSPVKELFLGQMLEFEVKSSSTSKGELTSFLQSHHNKIFPIDVHKKSAKQYICSTEPPATGTYMVHVRWNGEHVQESPFKLKIMSPPRPDKVTAYGPGLKNGFVGQAGNFTVETAEGGVGTLAVRVEGPKGALKVNMRRHPDSDCTILVQYDPTHVGQYTINITWSDMNIPGSPFAVKIQE